MTALRWQCGARNHGDARVTNRRNTIGPGSAKTNHGKQIVSTEQTAATNTREPQPELRVVGSAPAAPAGKGKGREKKRRLLPLAMVLAIIAVGGAGAWYWWQQHLNALPPGIAQANGRLEAEQVEIDAKLAGRIAVVLAKEGDMVQAGQVLARMDTSTLEAELQAAKAQVDVAEHKKTEAEAQIVQQESNLVFAKQELARATTLYQKGVGTGEKLDQQTNQMKVTQAAYDTAVAGREAAEATIAAAQAVAATIQSNIDDSTLGCPGRRPHPIQARTAWRGPPCGRSGPDAARPERCLHDDLRAGERRRAPRARR